MSPKAKKMNGASSCVLCQGSRVPPTCKEDISREDVEEEPSRVTMLGEIEEQDRIIFKCIYLHKVKCAFNKF